MPYEYVAALDASKRFCCDFAQLSRMQKLNVDAFELYFYSGSVDMISMNRTVHLQNGELAQDLNGLIF